MKKRGAQFLPRTLSLSLYGFFPHDSRICCFLVYLFCEGRTRTLFEMFIQRDKRCTLALL